MLKFSNKLIHTAVHSTLNIVLAIQRAVTRLVKKHKKCGRKIIGYILLLIYSNVYAAFFLKSADIAHCDKYI